MRNVGFIRQVSGEWNGAQELMRLRIEADNLDQPQDILIAPPDMQSLIDLLLALSGEAGPGPQQDISPMVRNVRTLPLDSVILSETEENGVVLELNVGRVALAFFLRADACLNLGQTLTTLGASRPATLGSPREVPREHVMSRGLRQIKRLMLGVAAMAGATGPWIRAAKADAITFGPGNQDVAFVSHAGSLSLDLPAQTGPATFAGDTGRFTLGAPPGRRSVRARQFQRHDIHQCQRRSPGLPAALVSVVALAWRRN